MSERLPPLLVEGYRRCARLTWQYGTTYFWGAVLLPRRQRKHVHAVYALCRLADDIIDLPVGGDLAVPVAGHPEAAANLHAFAEAFRTALVERHC